MKVLFRSVKRLTSWEVAPDRFYEAEFTNGAEADLRLSVYEVPDAQPELVRTVAEHQATFRDPKPRDPCVGFDADAGGVHGATIEETPGKTAFEFTCAAHREVCFMRETEVRAFATMVLAEHQRRTRSVPSEDVRRFMAERIAAGDEEWTALCDTKPKWRAWASRPATPPAAVPPPPSEPLPPPPEPPAEPPPHEPPPSPERDRRPPSEPPAPDS